MQAAATQTEQYAGSGVTLEGSPLLVLDQTRNLGQQEINQIYKNGQAQLAWGYQDAAQTRNRGRQALFGSFGTGGIGLLKDISKEKSATAMPPGASFTPINYLGGASSKLGTPNYLSP